MKALGRHLLIEFYNCRSNKLNLSKYLEKILCESAKKSKAKVIKTIFHNFKPFGVSGLVIIAESHFSIHTWPEYKFASIDIYTCGEEINPWDAYEYLKEKLKPANPIVMEMKRGILSIPEKLIKHKVNLKKS